MEICDVDEEALRMVESDYIVSQTICVYALFVLHNYTFECCVPFHTIPLMFPFTHSGHALWFLCMLALRIMCCIFMWRLSSCIAHHVYFPSYRVFPPCRTLSFDPKHGQDDIHLLATFSKLDLLHANQEN